MRILKVTAFIPGQLDQVFEYVTAFNLDGAPDLPAMEQKYGHFLEREGNTFKFLEDIGGGTNWECFFDPPRQRVMTARLKAVTYSKTWSSWPGYRPG